MNYGFFIDLDSCIGCKACEVACENEYVGSKRLNVKYIDSKPFPDTKRSFIPLRCNHCENAPCLKICPTLAIERTKYGTIRIEKDRCIGCKLCQMACPYSAISVNDGIADKCDACHHKLQDGFMPSCVSICPTDATLFGDLSNSKSIVFSKIAKAKDIKVRKANKGTKPKHFYNGALIEQINNNKTTIFNKKRD